MSTVLKISSSRSLIIFAELGAKQIHIENHITGNCNHSLQVFVYEAFFNFMLFTLEHHIKTQLVRKFIQSKFTVQSWLMAHENVYACTAHVQFRS
jgi:hypothetical protein